MKFIIPASKVLLDGIERVVTEYTKTHNPAHIRLKKILAATKAMVLASQVTLMPSVILDPSMLAQVVDDLDEGDDQPQLPVIDNDAEREEQIKTTLMGALVFCLDNIYQEYRFLYPEGTRISVGSALYQSICAVLGIPNIDAIDDHTQIITLSSFYFQMTNEKLSMTAQLRVVDPSIDFTYVEMQVVETIKRYFDAHFKPTDLTKGIPVEAVLDELMQSMPTNYTHENPEREFDAAIARAISLSRPASTTSSMQASSSVKLDDEPVRYLTQNEKIKLGWIIYVARSIRDSYFSDSRKPDSDTWLSRLIGGKSQLFDLCRQILNITKVDELDPTLQKACLAELHLYLLNESNIAQLKKFSNAEGDDEFTMKMLDQIQKVNSMRSSLGHSLPAVITPFTISVTLLATLLAAPVAYGAGTAVGFAISITSFAEIPRGIGAEVSGNVMHIVLGDAGKFLRFYAADLVIDGTLERAFGKLFEMIGMLVGFSTGAAVSIIIQEVSRQTLTQLANLVIRAYSHPELPAGLAKNYDPQWVQALLDLPPEVLAIEHKTKLRFITHTGGGVFSAASKSTPSLSNEMTPVLEFRGAGADQDLVLDDPALPDPETQPLLDRRPSPLRM